MTNIEQGRGNKIGPIPTITSEIDPGQIDSASHICGGFGSVEREEIAQAIVIICQERGSWRWAISAGDIKLVLQRLGYERLACPEYDLELRCESDGYYCPNVGAGRLLQKIAPEIYAVTDRFIEICYEHSPSRR